jgi:hypothetical protein
VRTSIDVLVSDDGRDVVQRESQLAVEQDSPKPEEVGLVVEPIAGGRADGLSRPISS